MIYFIILLTVIWGAIYIKPEHQSENKILFAIIVAFICLICGLRDMLGGYDNYIYGEIFDATARELREGISYAETTAFKWKHSEILYSFWNIILANLTTNRYVFFLVTAITFYTILYRHLTVYSSYPFIALFIFLCLFYFFTFTYLRQVLAVAIAWFAIPFAIKRSPIPFFGITALAILMHSASVMFVLLYFFANKRYSKQQYLLFYASAFIIGFTPIASFLVTILGENINTEKAVDTASRQGDARIAYIIESVFFLWYFIHNYHRTKSGKYSICMMNLTFLFIMTLIMFVRFENGGRLTWVFMIGISCWGAECIAHTRNRQTSSIIVMYTIMCLLYIRIVLSWGIQLNPYKSFLTNGVRDNDFIWKEYEYDHNYDGDKLYNL